MLSYFMYSSLNQQKRKYTYLERVLDKYFGGLEIRDKCSYVYMRKWKIYFFILE